MSQRSQRPHQERFARSQLAQFITTQPFLKGSLVQRSRSCGKPSCRCQRGHLHRSLYLAVRHHAQRVLLYIPRFLEDTVRQWVHNGRALSQQLQTLNQLQLDQLLLQKQQRAKHPTQPLPDHPEDSSV
jgi:hypothetical protein